MLGEGVGGVAVPLKNCLNLIMFQVSMQTVFQSDLSFSKRHLQTAHSYRPHAISENDYVCVRAFTRLFWVQGSQELVPPLLSGMQAASSCLSI